MDGCNNGAHSCSHSQAVYSRSVYWFASRMGYPCLLLKNAANAFSRSILVAGRVHRQEFSGAELDTLFASYLQEVAELCFSTNPWCPSSVSGPVLNGWLILLAKLCCPWRYSEAG